MEAEVQIIPILRSDASIQVDKSVDKTIFYLCISRPPILEPRNRFFLLGSSVGTVMRALAFPQCGAGSIPGWDVILYVGWVCWFSTLLREVFPWVLQFSPLTKNQHLIWFDLCWFDL